MFVLIGARAEDPAETEGPKFVFDTRQQKGQTMYIARFSYDLMPASRQQALDFIRQELQAARDNGLNGRILVPLTRGHAGGAALQFEVELANLDQLDQFRTRGVGTSEDTITGCANSARF